MLADIQLYQMICIINQVEVELEVEKFYFYDQVVQLTNQ